MSVQQRTDLRSRIEALGLVDPTDAKRQERRAAPPLETLRGKRMGLLDNRKGGADVLLERVREVLVEQHGVVEGLYRVKFGYSYLAEPEMLDDMARRCDLLITAVGD